MIRRTVAAPSMARPVRAKPFNPGERDIATAPKPANDGGQTGKALACGLTAKFFSHGTMRFPRSQKIPVFGNAPGGTLRWIGRFNGTRAEGEKTVFAISEAPRR
jgi:hypothetical protein